VDIEKGAIKLQQLAELDNIYTQPPSENEEVNVIANILQQSAQDEPLSYAAKTVLQELQSKQTATQSIAFDVTKAFKEPLNIFLAFSKDTFTDPLLVNNVEEFSRPLLNYNKSVESLELTERLTGKSARNANAISNELMKDLRLNTQYPPKDYPAQDSFTVINMIEEFCSRIQDIRQDKSMPTGIG
jgi:hypothetical protein